MHRSLAQRIEAWWDSKPLSAQLVTLITLLLAIGLSLSGTVMIGLLQRHLTSQIDDQLVATAHTMQISGSAATFSADGQGGIPTLYYIHIHNADGGDRYFYSEDTLKASGKPHLPELVDMSSAPVSSFRTLPVTVSSSIAGLGWRALVVPVYEQGSGHFSGYMTIALPLSDMQHTLRTTASYFSVAGIIIVLIGGWTGRVLVRRALLPLRSIESTAGKIAAGDLTKRVTPRPPTTEVGSLSLSLNAMLTQVEQSFDARQASEQKIKRFVSDASHELRTPLAAISGYCELPPSASRKSWGASLPNPHAWPHLSRTSSPSPASTRDGPSRSPRSTSSSSQTTPSSTSKPSTPRARSDSPASTAALPR